MDQDDPDSTQRFHPVPRRLPPPSGTPGRAQGAGRDMWARFRALPWVRQKQIAAISVVAALLLVGIVSTVAKEVGSGSSSSGSLASGTTPLGCAATATTEASPTCTGQAVLSRLCQVDSTQLVDVSTTLTTSQVVARQFGSTGAPVGSLTFYFDTNRGALMQVLATCFHSGRAPTLVIPPETWNYLVVPGSADLLPAELR